MPKPREEYMHILCRDRAYLAPLGQMGPIVHPLKVNKKAVVKLLINGCTVYEVNPATGATVELTLTNINDNSRFEKQSQTASPTEPSAPVKPTPVTGVSTEPSDAPAPADPETSQSEEQVVEDEKSGTSESAEASQDSRPSTEEHETGTAQKSDPRSKVEAYELVIKENGRVDETKIDWSGLTKEERRALRNRINTVNAEATASAKN